MRPETPAVCELMGSQKAGVDRDNHLAIWDGDGHVQSLAPARCRAPPAHHASEIAENSRPLEFAPAAYGSKVGRVRT